MKPRVYSRGGAMDPTKALADFETPLEIWVDNSLHRFTRRRHFLYRLWRKLSGRAGVDVVAVLVEPPCKNDLKPGVIRHHHRFRHILTFDEDVLAAAPNASLLPFGTTWIEGWPKDRPKRFEVSFLCGQKLNPRAPGHFLRREIWAGRKRLTAPARFFVSMHGGPAPEPGDQVLRERKDPLFESQFHICVENCRIKHYFTEKIMDCFMSHTVPIYWGCTNIGEYFDERGIIVANTLDEVIEAVNRLTPGDYASRKEAMARNRELAERYTDYGKRLNRKLIELGYKPVEAGPPACARD